MGSIQLKKTEDSEEELNKLVQIADSDDEEVEIDYTAVEPRQSRRTRFYSVTEIADQIALPGETRDSATSRALCFSYVYKGRYSIDLKEDKEFEEWRKKLELKVNSIKNHFENDQISEIPYRKRSHSVMAAFSFKKKQNLIENEDASERAVRYRNEYLENRKKQKVPNLEKMDEFESKLLDKAITHLINIENQCQKIKKPKFCRVPHNSISEENSISKFIPKLETLQQEDTVSDLTPENSFRKRIRSLFGRIRKIFRRLN